MKIAAIQRIEKVDQLDKASPSSVTLLCNESRNFSY